MTFYRHFVERSDFEPAVISSQPLDYDYPSLTISPTGWGERLVNTRFSRWGHSLRQLYAGRKIPAEVSALVDSFQPDAIFTVAGAWSWMAELAGTVASRYQLPLIGSFNDWWFYNQIYHPVFRSRLEKRFRNFYRRCDLAICTSEGMQDALGPHPNSIVLYPTGATAEATLPFQAPPQGQPLTLAFGGNLGDWYGRMIEQLVLHLEQTTTGIFTYRFYGSRPSWSQAFANQAESNGWFLGQVPFATLQQEMKRADILLLPMGFDPNDRMVESTSFKTKFLDYLTFQKPIFVWGPEYCSAVRTAREFDSAEICVDSSPEAAAQILQHLATTPDRQSQLVANSRSMYQSRFHPDHLHQSLVSAIRKVVGAVDC